MNRRNVHASLIALLALTVSLSVRADWTVSDASSVGYVSIKNQSVAENNRFTGVSGSLNAQGKVQILIDLSSVETRVEIRNQRMREYFFEVAEYPTAMISAQLEAVDLARIDAGAPVELELPLTVSLHGADAEVVGKFRAVKAGNQLLVSTLEPILVSAGDFGLEEGVAALQKLAGLNAISRAVPVTVDLRLIED